MNAQLQRHGVAGFVHGFSSMLHIVLGAGTAPPDGFSWHAIAPPGLVPTDPVAARALNLAMLNEGVHLMGDGLMVSSVHSEEDVATTVEAFGRALTALKLDGRAT
jgi:glutamate-1-semialdehyde aminotransferase